MTAEPIRLIEHKDEIENLYFAQGLSYQEIATQYGKSREAIRQFLNRYFPDRISGKEFRNKLNNQRKSHVQQLRAERRNEIKGYCVVCNNPVTSNYGGPRAKVRTCSKEHADLWVKARYILDKDSRDRQRISTAKSILKHEDRYSDSAVRWAGRVLNDGMPAKRSYRINTSQASVAYNEIMKIRAAMNQEDEEISGEV